MCTAIKLWYILNRTVQMLQVILEAVLVKEMVQSFWMTWHVMGQKHDWLTAVMIAPPLIAAIWRMPESLVKHNVCYDVSCGDMLLHLLNRLLLWCYSSSSDSPSLIWRLCTKTYIQEETRIIYYYFMDQATSPENGWYLMSVDSAP